MKPFLLFLFTVFLSGCSLLKIQLASDTSPLPKTELNLRVSTQQFISSAFSAISVAVDSVKRSETDKDIVSKTLIWGINTERELQKAALQQLPRYALVDTWLFVTQLNRFMDTEKADTLFKQRVELLRRVGEKMGKQLNAIARSSLSKHEYEEMYAFIKQKSNEKPFEDLRLIREPVYKEWLESVQIADSVAITTVGTLPEVMSDFTNRMAILKEGVENEAKWQFDLFSLHTGITPEVVKASSDSIAKLMTELVLFTQQSPVMLDSAMTHLYNIMLPMVETADKRIALTMAQVAVERQALSDIVLREREAIGLLVANERAAIMSSVDSLSVHLTREVMIQMKGVIATALGWITLLLAVIIFLPFAIGFFVGKVFSKRNQSHDQ